MNERPEALRLADAIDYTDVPFGIRTASTLRRLHAENERLTSVALQAQNAAIDLAKENERLREALEKIATVNAMDYEYVRWAKAALRREEAT